MVTVRRRELASVAAGLSWPAATWKWLDEPCGEATAAWPAGSPGLACLRLSSAR